VDHGPGQDRDHRRSSVDPGRASLAPLAPLLLAAALLLPAADHNATPLPDGWRPAVLADIPHVAAPRATYTSQSLDAKFRARADFDGDGQAEDAIVAVQPTTRRFAVFILTGGPTAVWEGDLDRMPDLGLHVAPPGAYATAACASDGECAALVQIPRSGLQISHGDGLTSLYWWVDGGVKQVRLLTLN
jgi:hypothetical protein